MILKLCNPLFNTLWVAFSAFRAVGRITVLNTASEPCLRVACSRKDELEMHTYHSSSFQRDARYCQAQNASARLTTDMLIVQGRRLSCTEGSTVSRNTSRKDVEWFWFIGAGSRAGCRARRHSISCTPRHSGCMCL